MKKRYILGIIVAFLILISFGVLTISAGSEGNGESTQEGSVDPHSSVSGFSKQRSGYLIYITDGAGTPVSDVRFVRYSSKPVGVRNAMATRVTNTPCTNFYDGTIGDATNQGFNKPPLDVTTGYGFGNEFKSWLISDNDGNGSADVFILIDNLFGSDMQTAFVENDYFLCIEGIMWCGISSSSNPTYIMGTTKTLNEKFNQAGSSYLSNTRLCRLPHAGYLTKSWAGCTAPTIHSGQKEAITDLIASGNGYGMVMVRSSELIPIIPEDPQPVEVRSDDYLKANELNYIFPDLIAGSTSGRSKDHYSTSTGYVDMNNKGNWEVIDTADLYRECKLDEGIWSVSEDISSEAVNFYGKNNCLYYRAGAGAWLKPSESKVFSESNREVYPGYGYLLSRALWGDNLTICDYKGNGSSYKAFITNRLKMSVGHIGGLTGVSAGVNTEAKVATTKIATYTFKGQATEFYKQKEIVGYLTEGTAPNTHQVPDYDWVDHTVSISQKVPATEIKYTLTHALYKYVPFDSGVVENLNNGETAYRSLNMNNAATKVIFASQLVDKLSMYPEVEYDMYYLADKEVYSTPTQMKVYCMGEKARECKPATLHGYNVHYSFGQNATGESIVDSALTGTNAFDFADGFGDTSQSYMQVCAQGSSFSTSSTNKAVIEVTSFTLDLYNDDINGFNPKSEWLSGDLVSSHDEFVSSVKENIEPSITAKRFTSVSNSSQFGDTWNMSFDYNSNISSTETSQIRLRYKDGSVNASDKNNVLEKIKSAYGVGASEAAQIWENWGIENQLSAMLESSTDSNNNSGVSGITADNWYDEESETFAITVCKSAISFGDFIFSDKSDYGSSTSQSPTDLKSVGSKGVQIRFYLTLKFKEPAVYSDGNSFDVSDKMLLINEGEFKGARFLISSFTSNDWLR